MSLKNGHRITWSNPPLNGAARQLAGVPGAVLVSAAIVAARTAGLSVLTIMSMGIRGISA